MPKDIILPALTADFESGGIEEWCKKVGDTVEVGDVIAEISTDKAIVELEASDAGTLGRILVEAGTNDVAVGTAIGTLLLAGETEADLDKPAEETPRSATDPARHEASVDASAADTAAGQQEAAAETDAGVRLRCSPSARRLAVELGVDLNSVEGSGPRGRIVRGDIVAAADARQGRPAAAAPREPAAPQGSRVALDNVRQTIARRMAEAKRDIPHFYLTVDCRVDDLLKMREQLNSMAADNVRISVNDLVVKACSLALRLVPAVNSHWDNDGVVQFEHADIAIAVATNRGLITPIVRRADTKSLATIAGEVSALSEKARNGRLQPDEFKGGSFTVSNLGMYRIREFSAIINPPQTCILAIGAAERRPVVIDDGLGVARMMSCTLSADHRAVDGAVGAEFLQAFKQQIEEPVRLVKDGL